MTCVEDNEWKNLCGEEKIEFQNKYTKNCFERVEKCLEQFEDFNQQKERIIYLIGNKVDDTENRIIKKEDAMKFAKTHKLRYFETSAYTGTNIKKVFNSLTLELIGAYPKKIEKNPIKINKKNLTKKSSSCCSKS